MKVFGATKRESKEAKYNKVGKYLAFPQPYRTNILLSPGAMCA